jgi:hypothetical protein
MATVNGLQANAAELIEESRAYDTIVHATRTEDLHSQLCVLADDWTDAGDGALEYWAAAGFDATIWRVHLDPPRRG